MSCLRQVAASNSFFRAIRVAQSFTSLIPVGLLGYAGYSSVAFGYGGRSVNQKMAARRSVATLLRGSMVRPRSRADEQGSRVPSAPAGSLYCLPAFSCSIFFWWARVTLNICMQSQKIAVAGTAVNAPQNKTVVGS